MIYFIVGYPCCGKTTIGKYFSKRESVQFFDLDEYISKTSKLEISEIFEKYGENGFRYIEKQCLHDLVDDITKNAIVSCGGGLPIFEDNMEFLLAHGKVIWLNADLKIIMKRLVDNEIEKRPLLYEEYKQGKLFEYIQLQFEQRKQFYQKANFTISSEYEKENFNFEWS